MVRSNDTPKHVSSNAARNALLRMALELVVASHETSYSSNERQTGHRSGMVAAVVCCLLCSSSLSSTTILWCCCRRLLERPLRYVFVRDHSVFHRRQTCDIKCDRASQSVDRDFFHNLFAFFQNDICSKLPQKGESWEGRGRKLEKLSL